MSKEEDRAPASERISYASSDVDWAPMSAAPSAAPCSPSGSDEADEARILLQLAQAPVEPTKQSPSSLLQLHACNNCQRAKTACNDERPCGRCVRLGVSRAPHTRSFAPSVRAVARQDGAPTATLTPPVGGKPLHVTRPLHPLTAA